MNQPFHPPIRIAALSVMFAAAALISGCIKTEHVVKTEHTINPIQINISVRVQKELDDFFGDLDSESTTVKVKE